MGKIVNITEKLDFEENPKIQVKEEVLEVNADATTVLKIVGSLGEDGKAGPSEVTKMYELLFSERDRKKIDKMKLQFKDFQTLIYEAINLVTGETEEGEQ